MGETIDDGRKFGRLRNQLMVVLCADIAMICMGHALVWTSPILPLLESEDTPLTTGPLTVEQVSWIGGLVNIAAAFSVLIYGLIAYWFGLKIALWTVIVPGIASWILVLTTRQVEYIFATRVFGGFLLGSAFSCIPLFVVEIADPIYRGRLLGLMTVMWYTGIVSALLIGSYVAYDIAPYVYLVFPIIFGCLWPLVPNTPHYLLRKGKEKEAEKSVRFYGNYKNDSQRDNQQVQAEMQKVKMYLLDLEGKKRLKFKDFFTSDCRIAYLNGICLCILMAFNGNLVIISYAWNIFRDSGSDFDSQISSIIVGCIQLLGAICSTALVDRIGRKRLLALSSIGSTIGLSLLGAYNYLSLNGVDVNVVNWVPIVSLSLAVFSSCSGLVPVTATLIPEILPSKVRQIGTRVLYALMQFLLGVAIMLFPILTDIYEMYVTMWIFAAVCFSGFIYSVFIVKETVGKDLHQ